VGHCFGAHACGHAGHEGQIGRITGLEPTGLLYEERDWSVGLNPSCADLVDVIHTNCRVGLGISKAVGHVDFYPNGGTIQPGCTSDSATELMKWKDYLTWDKNEQDASLHLVGACSHLRSIEYFKESIRTPCFICRFTCSSLLLFPLSCTESTNAVQSMGFNASAYSGHGILYLETNPSGPFCRE